MLKLPRISSADLPELQHWLNLHGVATNNLAKDCADAVIVAKLLNNVLQNAVYLDNFVPITNYEGRVQNWQLLNKQILRLTGISLDKQLIALLAEGYVNGLIESLLFAIKKSSNTCKNPKLLSNKHKPRTLTFKKSCLLRFRNLEPVNVDAIDANLEDAPPDKDTQCLKLIEYLARRISVMILILTYIAIVMCGLFYRIFYYK